MQCWKLTQQLRGPGKVIRVVWLMKDVETLIELAGAFSWELEKRGGSGLV